MATRFFKKSKFKSKEGQKFTIFTPTIKKKGQGIVKISDKFRKKKREKIGGLDTTFVIPIKKRK